MFHEINNSLKIVTQTFENLICLNINSYKIHEIHRYTIYKYLYQIFSFDE